MFNFRGLLTGRDRAALPPGARALQLHLAPVIIIAAGALLVLASMFMPAISSSRFATITGNALIQNDPGLLLCSVAATIAAVRYWKTGSRASAHLAIAAGAWFLAWAIIDSHGLAVNGPGLMQGFADDPGLVIDRTSSANAGAGLWTAGVGSLLIALSGVMMRYPHLSFGVAAGAAAPREEQSESPATKVCPNCAETVKAAAAVCRFCHYQFNQAKPIHDGGAGAA